MSCKTIQDSHGNWNNLNEKIDIRTKRIEKNYCVYFVSMLWIELRTSSAACVSYAYTLWIHTVDGLRETKENTFHVLLLVLLYAFSHTLSSLARRFVQLAFDTKIAEKCTSIIAKCSHESEWNSPFNNIDDEWLHRRLCNCTKLQDNMNFMILFLNEFYYEQFVDWMEFECSQFKASVVCLFQSFVQSIVLYHFEMPCIHKIAA